MSAHRLVARGDGDVRRREEGRRSWVRESWAGRPWLLAAVAVLLGALTFVGTTPPSAGAASVAEGTPSATSLPDVGTVYISEAANNRVLEVTPGSTRFVATQFTVGTGLNSPEGLAVDDLGNLSIADANHSRVVKVTPGGAQTTVGAGLSGPMGVAADATGNLFIADTLNNRVVKVTADGAQTDVVTGFGHPYGVAVDATGNIYTFNPLGGSVTKVTPSGTQASVASGLTEPSGVAVDAVGNVYIADFGNNQVDKVTPDGTRTTIGTGLNEPAGVAVDAVGNVYIADFGNNQVDKVTPDGTQTTIGTGLNKPVGVAVYAPAPTFTRSTPPRAATVGNPYSYTYAASTPAGEPAATFAIADGSLPPGLHLNATTGVLSGTPTTPGTFTFTAETMNAARGTLAAPVSITVVDPAGAYVNALYHDFLGRSPDPAGLRFWIARLHDGTSHRTVSTTLAGSREALGHFVNGQYQHILGRTADVGGRDYWISRLRAHIVSTNALTVALYASTERYVAAGGTDAAWVDAMYTKALGRTPSSSEVDYWVRQIHLHGRSAVARVIVTGAEATNRDVDTLYATLLGRTPDDAGRSFTRTVIQRFGVLAAATGISATREYATHAQQRFG